MELGERIHQLEEELALVKTEIRAVLIDLREELLERQGPFTPVATIGSQGGSSDMAPPAPIPFPGSRTVQTDAMEWEPSTEASPPMIIGARQATGPGENVFASHASHEAMTAAGFDPRREGLDGEREWTVLSIASLGKWAEAATKRIGRRRVEELLSVYSALTGRPDETSRSALLRMLDLCNASEEPANVAMNDLVAVLSQLDGIVRTGGGGEATMLSLLAEAA